MEKPLLKPTSEFVFRLLFGDARNLDILQSFLLSFLGIPPEEFERLELPDPVVNPETFEVRDNILDVRVITKHGKNVNVEIQTLNYPVNWEYLSDFLMKASMNVIMMGPDFHKTKKFVSVLLVDSSIQPDKENYHQQITWGNAEDKSSLRDLIEVHILQIPKLPGESDGTRLWDWMHFLKSRKEGDFEEAAQRGPEFGKAVNCLKEISGNEILRKRDHAHKLERMEMYGLLNMDMGDDPERIKKNAAQMGFDTETLALMFNLGPEEAEQLSDKYGKQSGAD